MKEYIINQNDLNVLANTISQAYPNVVRSMQILNTLQEKVEVKPEQREP